MKLNKIILISSLALSPLFSNSIDNKIKGKIIVEPNEFEIPSFPKATFTNEKDTFIYQGNHLGQINYSLNPGNYDVKLEPGKDTLTNTNGDYFLPFTKNIEIKNKELTDSILTKYFVLTK